MKWWLLAVCLIVCALPATAQFFNLSRVGRPSETTFANGNQPWPFGATINAINYDVGGQGIAYNVPSPSGSCLQSSSYRPDTVNFNNTPAGGVPYQLGCSSVGLSYNYTINVSGTGPYTVIANLADTSAGGSWGIYLDNISIGTIATPNTGSFTTFQSALLSAPFNTVPGNHVLLFRALGGDAAFNGSGDFLSFIVTVPSMGGTASCGSGGPSLTIPAGAMAAGFTTCAMDFDPANGVSCMAGNCVPISPISGWLDIGNCNDGAQFHQWYFNEDGLPPANCPPDPTTQVQIVTDSVGGLTAMQLTYTHITDWNAGIQSAKVTSESPFGNPNPPGTGFPQANYTESVVRVTTSTWNVSTCPSSQPGGCILADNWSYAPGTSTGAEWDFIEIYTNGGTGSCGGGIGNSGGCANGSGGLAQPGRLAGFDPTIYHNYGVRQTIDSSGNLALCHYLDGSQITNDPTGAPACAAQTGPIPGLPSSIAFRVQMIMETGPQGVGAGAPLGDEVMMERRFTVWACPGWNGSAPGNQCNTAILKSSP